MSKNNSTRKGCKDVFHAFMVENATYDGELEIPCLKQELQFPNRLISFSKAIHSSDTNAWVHFFEDDVGIERLWNQPNRYLPILKRFNGVISPDFSIYRDMPLVMQYWNIYRSRAVGHWLQENGIAVIPNIRFGDKRTLGPSCAGIEKHGVIAIGSHGCIKLLSERHLLKTGLEYVVQRLEPAAIVVYGTAPDEVFGKYRAMGIEIFQYDSDFSQSRKAVNC